MSTENSTSPITFRASRLKPLEVVFGERAAECGGCRKRKEQQVRGIKTVVEDLKALWFEYLDIVNRDGACRFQFEVCERATEIERALAREGRFRRGVDTKIANESSSRPKYCWRRVDFESSEGFVRGKRRSTSEGYEH